MLWLRAKLCAKKSAKHRYENNIDAYTTIKVYKRAPNRFIEHVYY
jgi:hypothetical protein